MSAKIIGVNTGKENHLLHKETAEDIMCQEEAILSLNSRNFF
jgi:hypothetical protein